MKNKTLKIKKKVINLYNFWHLGDNIFTMIYLYNCKDYIIKNKVKKEHLENYFKYLFTQADDLINKYEEKLSNLASRFSLKRCNIFCFTNIIFIMFLYFHINIIY